MDNLLLGSSCKPRVKLVGQLELQICSALRQLIPGLGGPQVLHRKQHLLRLETYFFPSGWLRCLVSLSEIPLRSLASSSREKRNEPGGWNSLRSGPRPPGSVQTVWP